VRSEITPDGVYIAVINKGRRPLKIHAEAIDVDSMPKARAPWPMFWSDGSQTPRLVKAEETQIIVVGSLRSGPKEAVYLHLKSPMAEIDVGHPKDLRIRIRIHYDGDSTDYYLRLNALGPDNVEGSIIEWDKR
jgi:hypothetical protein